MMGHGRDILDPILTKVMKKKVKLSWWEEAL